MAEWIVGVALNLAGSILVNLGTNMMKLGFNQQAEMIEASLETAKPARRIWQWQLGMLLFTGGNIANFWSFGYAAQSLLAGLGCVQFISNVCFASLVLKEKVTLAIIVAVSCIVGGGVLLVSFGSRVDRTYTTQELMQLYREPAYIAYMGAGAAVVLLCYSAFLFGQHAIRIKGKRARVWAAVLPVVYSLPSAILGTQGVLFSKSVAVLLKRTLNGDSQVGNWFTWVALGAFLFTAVFWVSRLNQGLRMFPAMLIVPTLQICWVLFSIVSGMLYFQEYKAMHILQGCMFALGVMFIFAGVLLLTQSSARATANTQPEADAVTELTLAKVASKCNSQAKEYYNEILHDRIGTIPEKGSDDEASLSPNACLQLAASYYCSTIEGYTSDSEVHHRAVALGLQSQTASDHRQSGSQSAPLGYGMGAANLRLPQARQAWQVQGNTIELPSSLSHRLSRHSVLSAAALPVRARTAYAGGKARASSCDGSDPAGLRLDSSVQEGAGTRSRPTSQRVRSSVASGFGLDKNRVARLPLGFGDSDLPGVSLFTVPVVDLSRDSSIWAGTSRRTSERGFKYDIEASIPARPD